MRQPTVDFRRFKLFLMFCDKLANGGDKIRADLHYGVVLLHKCRFILGHRFFRCLLLIVSEDTPNPVFVPSRGKFALGRICLLRLRFRQASNGLPLRGTSQSPPL